MEEKEHEWTKFAQKQSQGGSVPSPAQHIHEADLQHLCSLLNTLQGHRLAALSCVFVAIPRHDKTAHVDVVLPFDLPGEPQAGPPGQ